MLLARYLDRQLVGIDVHKRSHVAALIRPQSESRSLFGRAGHLRVVRAARTVSEEIQLERNAPWLEQSIRSDRGRTHWMRSSRPRSRRASGLKLTPTRTRSSSWAATANRSGAACASTAPAAATWYRSTSVAR